MNQIQNILKCYDTDKANDTEHSYGDFYAQLFEKFDRLGELNILELGVQRGGSLYGWQEYFPNAHIYGVDITDTRLEKYKVNDDIKFFEEDLKSAIKHFEDIKFDIIIDDSDHFDGTMAWIAGNYFPLLNQKGVLVFEDVQIPERYIQTITAQMPSDAVLKTFDFRDIKPRPDDFIITLSHA